MIGAIAKALGISDLAVTVAALGLLVLAIIGGVAYIQHREAVIYSRGVEAGEAKITAAVATATANEAARQRAAYEPVLAGQRQTIEALTVQRNDLNQALQDNANAAAADPRRDECGLSLDGVRRYNSLIRRGPARPAPAR
jgi:hypothetical protein